MKKLFFASLIGLLPTLLMAQQTVLNNNVKGKPVLQVMVARPETPVDNNTKTAKELRKAERQKAQFARTVKAFSREFENVSNVQWSSGKSQHTINFTKDNIKTIAWYSKGGQLLYTMLSYSEDKLPGFERDLIKKEFSGFKITQVQEVREVDTVVYIIHLQDDASVKLVTIHDDITNLYREYRKS